MAQLLAGFAPVEVDVDGIRTTGRTAGTGPPVHAEYSERAMAADQVAVMASLGFDTFAAGFVGRHYDVAAVWQSYATDVSTTAITSAGHFLAEEAPAATAAALSQFLR